MRKIGLLDGTFNCDSVSYGGENFQRKPKYFEWSRNDYRDITVFTDIRLSEVDAALSRDIYKIALLIEPSGFTQNSYKYVLANQHKFDMVISYDLDFLSKITKAVPKFAPCGGSWIDLDEWQIHGKEDWVSIIGTDKQKAVGHQARHQVIKELSKAHGIHVYGRGYNPIASKQRALNDYRYSIVIESCRVSNYFSEKLIDCFATGTVPIYWGCPGVADFFDTDGMICLDELTHLEDAFYMIDNLDYWQRLPAIEKNMEEAKKYVCLEDWLALNIKEVFGEKT